MYPSLLVTYLRYLAYLHFVPKYDTIRIEPSHFDQSFIHQFIQSTNPNTPSTNIMKSATVFLASLLAAVAVAQPHSHQHQHEHEHQHQQLHRKREQQLVWVTSWDLVTETIPITTTIWVSSGFVAPTTSSNSTSSATELAAQFYQGTTTPSTSSSATPTHTTSSSTSSSSSSSVYVAPTTLTSSSVYVPPPPPPSPSSTYVAPIISAAPIVSITPVVVSSPPAPVTTPAAAQTTTAAVAPVETSSSSSGSSSVCPEGSPCSGDITYYTAGLGACGWTNDGNTENVVALPWELMGSESNDNPFCGMTITILCVATGKTTTATVVDKCMGCTGYSIDLSVAAFQDLDDLSVGRTTATWYFN